MSTLLESLMRCGGPHLNSKGSRQLVQRQFGAILTMKSLKQQIRQRIIEKRLQLDPKQQQQAAQRIAAYLLQTIYYQQAQHIAFYNAANGEMPTNVILQKALLDQKCCYLPVLQDNQCLHFVRWDGKAPLVAN